jgi:hypothetical protein
VTYAEGVDERYGVKGLPTMIGIDRAGRMRYRAEGFASDTLRTLEVVVDELLK